MITLLCMLMVTQPAARATVSPAPALTEADVRARIETYLDTFEQGVPEAQWQALGPQAEPILLEVLNGNGLPTRRAKAVTGLVALAGVKTPALLSDLSLDETKPLSVRLAAVRGLSQLTPDVLLVEKLRPVVEGAKDVRVSATAARMLVKRVPASACGLVRARGGGDIHFQSSLTACANH
ncbi:MAG TPA: hypothetical protein VH083_09325 [Myxococcales bacterium]|jgi:hypothetical protein|nr:hypothetical protein [Myxococcales bacterium]